MALHGGQLRPVRQVAVQIPPTIQGSGQQDGAALAANASLGIERRTHRRNTQALIAAGIAKLPRQGRFTQRTMQATGQVIALALEVVAGAIEVEPVHRAPTTARSGVGLVHGKQLQCPQCLETVQAVTLEQRFILALDEVLHSRPSK